MDPIAHRIDSIADSAEFGFNYVGDLLADLLETPGNLLVGNWLGNVIAGIANLLGGVIKGVTGIAGGFAAGFVRLVLGIFTIRKLVIRSGVFDLVASLAGAVILIFGQLVSLVQRIFMVQGLDRKLTDEERVRLREVFGNSLALRNIRIIEGKAGLLNSFPNPFTLGNTVYLKGANLSEWPSLLIHECAHVWQYQNMGSRYTADAILARLMYGLPAYQWLLEFDRGHPTWWTFNAEAKAEFLQDVWDHGSDDHGSFFRNSNARYVVEGGEGYSEFARESVAFVRQRRNSRLFR